MFNLPDDASRDQEQALQLQRIATIEASLQARLAKAFMRHAGKAGARYAAGGAQMVYGMRDELVASVAAALEKAIAKAAAQFTGDVQRAASDAGKAGRWQTKASELEPTWLEMFMRSYFQERIFPASSVIADTMQSELAAAITAGIDQGLGQRAIGNAITDRLTSIADYQAARIARTEVHSAAMQSTQAAVGKIAPEALKRWVTASDSRVRAVRDGDQFGHRAMHGVTLPLAEMFQVPRDGGTTEEMSGPGDPNGSPGNIINCRCTLVYEDPEFKSAKTRHKASTAPWIS